VPGHSRRSRCGPMPADSARRGRCGRRCPSTADEIRS
jgi:hypothetical protein